MTCKLYGYNLYLESRVLIHTGKQVTAMANNPDALRVTPKFKEHFATISGGWAARKESQRQCEEFTLNLNSGFFVLQYSYIKKQNQKEGRSKIHLTCWKTKGSVLISENGL